MHNHSKDTVQGLTKEIKRIRSKGAYHRRRGYKINELPLTYTTAHLIEEAVELHSEFLSDEYDTDLVIDEASDVLTHLIHTLIIANINFADVVRRSKKKLKLRYTLNKRQVLTKTARYTRGK